MVGAMEGWIRDATAIVTALVAMVALIVSIWASRRAARRREFEILLERIDREAAKREKQFETEAVKREAETRVFTERIDREAAKREKQFETEAVKREEAIRALMDRSDRKFEALLARSDELSRQLTEVTGRVMRTEAVLETVRAGRQRAAVQPTPATGETEVVAAQGVPGGRPTE